MATRRPLIGAAGTRVLVRLSQVDMQLRVLAAERLARVTRMDEYRTAELYMAAVMPRTDEEIWTTAEKAERVLRDRKLP